MTKKTLALVASMVMLLSLASCANNQYSQAGAVVTVSIMDKGRCPVDEGDMSNNRWTEYIDRESGVDVEFIPVARDNFEENLNLLIAGGTLPDIMITYESTYVQQMINQGLIQPVGDFIDTYSTTCKEYLQANPALESWLTFNGELYAMSNIRSSVRDQGAWIRQDWLDELDLNMPRTEAEFLDVCRAFKEASLGGDKTVPVALMRYYWGYFTPLYAACDEWYLDDDGNVEYGVLTERFASAVDLMKTCYDESLISMEFATDTDSAIATQNWVNGRSGVLLYKSSATLIQELIENDPQADPVPMPPFETRYGQYSFLQSQLPTYYVMLSSKIEHPEEAIRFLDWLLADGWSVLQNGFEGTHYTIDKNGNPVAVSDEVIRRQLSYSSAYILLSQYEETAESVLASAATDELHQRLAKLEAESIDVNSSYSARRDIFTSPDVDEYGVLYADWSLIEQQLMIKAITGGDSYDVEDMYKEMLLEWNALGGENVTSLVQAWYDKNAK